MASERQIAANRRNAQRSTGPRTQVGKERVSRNAYRHGLRSARLASESHGQEIEDLANKIGDGVRLPLNGLARPQKPRWSSLACGAGERP